MALIFALKVNAIFQIISWATNTELLNSGISNALDPELVSTDAFTGSRRANTRQVGNRLFLGGVISSTIGRFICI